MSKTSVSRRQFLTTMGVGTAAAAAVVATRQAANAPAPDSAKQQGKRGYQLTEHVKNYYRTAQV